MNDFFNVKKTQRINKVPEPSEGVGYICLYYENDKEKKGDRATK